MPITFRQYINSESSIQVDMPASATPSVTPLPASVLPSSTPPSASVTPSVTPPISPSVTPSPTVSSTKYYFYNAIQGTCNPLVGTCEGVGADSFVYSSNGSLTLGLWYTGSVSTVYQPYEEIILDYLPLSITIDNNPYNSCAEACKLPVCYVSSSLIVTQPGWISYVTCGGSTVYQELCEGSHSINDCIKCETVAGSAGPGGSGSYAQVSTTCGFPCFDPPPPSVSSTPSISVTPSATLSPSVTRTPSVTPSPTNTPSITNTPSVTPTPPISPSCECDASYTSSFDGSTCYSSSYAPAISGSTVQTPKWAGTDQAWGDFGVKIYPAGGFNIFGDLTVSNYAYLGLSQAVPTSSVNKFWSRRLNSVGMWDGANQYWTGYWETLPDGNKTLNTNGYPGYLSMCATINVPSTKTYYIGLAGDNDVTVKINGTTIVNQPDTEPTNNFKWWHIYPVTLTAGPNIVEAGNFNRSIVGTFAVEVYDNTLAQLTSSNAESDLNIVFSTGNYLEARTIIYPDSKVYDDQTGTYTLSVSKSYADGPYLNQAFCSNYTCPTGFELDLSNPSVPRCRRNTLVPNCSVPPSVTPTPSVVPSNSVSPTPSITATPSDTPCPTVSVSPSLTPTMTPTPSLGCTCRSALIIDNNLYYYYDCNRNYVSGGAEQGSVICMDINMPYSRNIGNIGFSGNDVCGNCYDEV